MPPPSPTKIVLTPFSGFVLGCSMLKKFETFFSTNYDCRNGNINQQENSEITFDRTTAVENSLKTRITSKVYVINKPSIPPPPLPHITNTTNTTSIVLKKKQNFNNCVLENTKKYIYNIMPVGSRIGFPSKYFWVDGGIW